MGNLTKIQRLEKYKNINENCFQEINEFSAYFIGFLFADGSIDRHWNTLSMQLQERDVEILNKLKDFVGIKCELSTRVIKNKKYHGIKISNKKIKADLIKHGITPDKTKNPTFPDFNGYFFWHFLRGLTDGDGSIYFNGKRVSWGLTCHEMIALQLKNKIELETGIHVTIQDHWRTNYIKTLSVNGIHNCYKFMNLLYNNSNISLSRKELKYKNFILWYKDILLNKVKNKFIGVNKDRDGKYNSVLFFNNKRYYLGRFLTAVDAAKAYDAKIDKLKINRLKNFDIINNKF